MKKVTLVFALFCIISSTVSAQKAERKPFNKAAAEEFADYELQNQLYLSGDEKFVLTNVKYDTARDAKKGHLIREVTETTTTVTIRKGEKGKVVEWENDNLVWVTFDSKDRQGLKLPFVPSASGKGNSGNNLVLRTDSICGYQYNGDAIPCKPSARKITLGSLEDEDMVTYTFQVDKPKLEYEPIDKKVKKVNKVTSKGVKVK
jgi:hypothetical protein